MRNYWIMLRDQAKERFESGMSILEAANDIDLGPYINWGGPERVFLNVNSLYKEFGSNQIAGDVMSLFMEMGAIWDSRCEEKDLPVS